MSEHVLKAAEGRAYERGYLDALRDVEGRLSGSAAFNCGRHRGYEYPNELVQAMIRQRGVGDVQKRDTA